MHLKKKKRWGEVFTLIFEGVLIAKNTQVGDDYFKILPEHPYHMESCSPILINEVH